jgi:hypothetical protein
VFFIVTYTLIIRRHVNENITWHRGWDGIRYRLQRRSWQKRSIFIARSNTAGRRVIAWQVTALVAYLMVRYEKRNVCIGCIQGAEVSSMCARFNIRCD